MATKGGDIDMDDDTRAFAVDGLLSVCKVSTQQPWTSELHQVRHIVVISVSATRFVLHFMKNL